MTGLYDEVRLALHGIWTRRWLALGVAWGVCVLGWLVVAQIPNRYESRARISIQIQSVLPGKIGITDAEQQKTIDRVRQTLTSATNLAQVVRTTDLAKSVARDEDVADQVGVLARSIKVTAQQDDLFEITATAASPKVAAQIVARLIDLFVEQNLAGNRTENAQTLDFLDKQLAERQRQLQDSESQRAAFQSRYLAAMPGSGSLNDRIAAARSQMAQVESDLAAAQSSLSAVNAQMAGTPPSVAGTGGGASGPARARVATIMGQLADAKARGWTEAHPDVVALRSQLAIAQAAARSEPLSAAGEGTPNPLFLSLRSLQAERQAQLAALTTRRDQLRHDVDQLQSKLTDDPEIAAEQAQLERDSRVLKDQYDKLLADREEIKLRGQVQSQTDAIKFSIIDPPGAPTTPIAPNRLLLLTGVLVAGLAAGIGAGFAMGQLKTTFATSAQLERTTGMSVIGSIGEMLTEIQANERRRRLRYFAGAAGGLAIAYVGLIGVEFLQRGLAA